MRGEMDHRGSSILGSGGNGIQAEAEGLAFHRMQEGREEEKLGPCKGVESEVLKKSGDIYPRKDLCIMYEELAADDNKGRMQRRV